MLNRIMVLLVDAVCYLAMGAGLYAVMHAGDFVAPASVNPVSVNSVSANVGANWPLMHPSAARFMWPQGAASKEKE
jgi:hypothetical protein